MHAMRTPLTVVILRVNLMRRRLQGSDDQRQLDDDLARVEAGLAQVVVAIAALDRAELEAGDDGARRSEPSC
jgi:hypothetical protein